MKTKFNFLPKTRKTSSFLEKFDIFRLVGFQQNLLSLPKSSIEIQNMYSILEESLNLFSSWVTINQVTLYVSFVDEEMVCFLNEFAFFVILRNGPSNFIFDLLIYKWGAKLLYIFLQYHLFPILSLLATTFKFIWAYWIINISIHVL